MFWVFFFQRWNLDMWAGSPPPLYLLTVTLTVLILSSSLRTGSQQMAWRHFVGKSIFVVFLFNLILCKISPLSNHVALPLDPYSHNSFNEECLYFLPPSDWSCLVMWICGADFRFLLLALVNLCLRPPIFTKKNPFVAQDFQKYTLLFILF